MEFSSPATPPDNSMYLLKSKHGDGLDAEQSVIKQSFPYFISKDTSSVDLTETVILRTHNMCLDGVI